MPHPRLGFVELGIQPLDEPVRCPSCGAELVELRVMERRGPKETVWLYDCPSCGTNVSGGRGHGNAQHPPLW